MIIINGSKMCSIISSRARREWFVFNKARSRPTTQTLLRSWIEGEKLKCFHCGANHHLGNCPKIDEKKKKKEIMDAEEQDNNS